MIDRIVDFALDNRHLVLLATLALIGGGLFAFHRLPIEAYPDVADTWVVVITQWEGHASEEVENLVTTPLETAMNGVPNVRVIRSTTIAGLSWIGMIFDEGTDAEDARRDAFERLADVQLPDGVTATLGPMVSPTGEILRFVLVSCAVHRVSACTDADVRAPSLTLNDLRDIEQYIVEPALFAAEGVADVSTFGGTIRQYQALVDPYAMIASGITFDQIVQAAAQANQVGGGGMVNHGEQVLDVRSLGLLKPDMIGDVVIVTRNNGNVIRIRDVAVAQEGYQTRLGRLSLDQWPDVVGATVVMRKGDYADQVLPRVHAAIGQLNTVLLPRGVKLDVYSDRSDLRRITTATVLRNMSLGIALVSVILLVFLGNVRSALLVAITIPLSLLFAFICLDVARIPANLLSIGAIDFGMIVDGSIVMAENIFRRAALNGTAAERRTANDPTGLTRAAASEVSRPIVFAVIIIIAGYLPLFTLQSTAGKLFRPMAWTVGSALLGAVLVAITVVPVLASYFFRRRPTERRNLVLDGTRRLYLPSLRWFLAHRSAAPVLIASVLLLNVVLYRSIGSEFLPHLNEGALTVHAQLPIDVSFDKAREIVDGVHTPGNTMPGLRDLLALPEVGRMSVELGRPDDGTDPSSFYNVELNLFLKDRSKWRPQFHGRREILADAVDSILSVVPGVVFGISQPISDNVEEAMNGVKGELAAKVYGPDLATLDALGRRVAGVLAGIEGIEDVSLQKELGQSNLNVRIDRTRAERYGLGSANIGSVANDGVGGKVATRIREGAREHDLVVRFAPQFRSDLESVRRLPLALDSSGWTTLAEVADVSIQSGAARIFREEESRYIAASFSVRERDMGSAVAEAQARVRERVPLPPGYRIAWGGEFESAQRAAAHFAVVIPMTLVLIFILLSFLYGRLREGLIVLGTVVITSPVGGLFALWITGTNLSVSSAVGFLALFGVSVQTGVILVSYMNDRRREGASLDEAILAAADRRLRPVMMTGLVASLGLLPAALSTNIGSDSQRPLAIVVVGGTLSALALSLYLIPSLYQRFALPVSPKPEGRKDQRA